MNAPGQHPQTMHDESATFDFADAASPHNVLRIYENVHVLNTNVLTNR